MAELLETDGTMRAADVALRNAAVRHAGSRAATLRMPGLAASGDDAEQLGLATPAFQDLSLGPVTFQSSDRDNKLLVSASAVLALTQTLQYDSADVLFRTAAGVLVGEVLYGIMESIAAGPAGSPYGYWLTLREPAR